MKTLLATTTMLIPIGYNSGDQGSTITTPAGRIVWGHPAKPKPATDQHGQPKMGSDGQQLMETSFGLAIPQEQFQAEVWPVMYAEMSKGYPQGAPGNFSWKITQPHEIDNKGKPYAEREGYAGCVVLAISTTLEPPGIFKWAGSQWQQMQADELKTGDYVQVEVNFKVNVPRQPTHTPSLYVNPRGVAFVGYGEEIRTGYQTDPNAAFGNGPAALPAGASATPVGGSPAGVGMPTADPTQQPPQGGGMPPAAPQAAPVPQQTTAPQPAPQVAPQPAMPAAPAASAPPAAVSPAPVDPAQQQGGALPPPATGFVDGAAAAPPATGAPAMPAAPAAAPPAGMPGQMPPR